MQHGDISHDILIEKGFSEELAKTIKYHNVEKEPDKITWEIKCLRYADSRVLHDKIVSIKERIEYAQKRYPELGKDFPKKAMYLEKEIFEIIDINPEEIK